MGESIGIDIGGTAVKAGRLAGDGSIEERLEKPSPAREGPEVMAALVAQIVRELGGSTSLPLGVGCAGLVDPWRGSVLTSPNLPGWTVEAPLADLVAERAGIRPLLLNDANAFVLAETRLGAGRGASTVIGLTLGTGVGGGLVLDGKLYIGRHGAAGEIGHMPLHVDGPLCACGARGCLEAMVGTRAILARYRETSGAAPVPSAASDPAAAAPAPEQLTVRLLAQRAGNGDAAALATFRETGRFLGLALAGLTQLLDPDLFVVGGGIARSSALFLPAVREALASAAMLPVEMQPRVEPASLGHDAGWIGAARAAVESATT